MAVPEAASAGVELQHIHSREPRSSHAVVAAQQGTQVAAERTELAQHCLDAAVRTAREPRSLDEGTSEVVEHAGPDAPNSCVTHSGRMLATSAPGSGAAGSGAEAPEVAASARRNCTPGTMAT